jgi:hypothetical protein
MTPDLGYAARLDGNPLFDLFIDLYELETTLGHLA